MRVMILDDDPLIARLLQQAVLSLRPEAQFVCFARLQEAIESWKSQFCDLVLADWNLPDGTGVELFELIRAKDANTPLVMITGRTDRASVLTIRRLNINDFISKPIQIQRLLTCLEKLLPSATERDTTAVGEADFLAHLSQLAADDLDIPLLGKVKDSLQLSEQGEQLDLRELAANWQNDPALISHLLSLANSSAYMTSGKPCLSLTDALQRLGGPASLNFALSLALRQASQLSNDSLKARVVSFQDEAERLSEQVQTLANQCGLAPAVLQGAALLHRIGELCVLFQAADWESRGHTLDETQVQQAIAEFSKPFAIDLKAHWRLPRALRGLIGAVYALPRANVPREQVLMRLAAAELAEEDADEIKRLRRLAGLA